MMSLDNKRVLITGGGQGIGRTIAEAFAASGASLVLSDINRDTLDRTARELRDQGYDVTAHVADVTDVEALREMRRRIHRDVGPVDILVNNAGVVFGGNFLQLPLEQHKLTYDVNITGMTNVTWVFLPDLLERPEARIVNIASASSLVGLPYGTSYCASKWAALGFSESLRLELKEEGHTNIHVTAVCPSYINTGMFNGVEPPRLTRMLEPDQLAKKIVASCLRGDAMLMEPFMVKLTPLLKLLPVGLLDMLGRALGVTTSMRHWQGH